MIVFLSTTNYISLFHTNLSLMTIGASELQPTELESDVTIAHFNYVNQAVEIEAVTNSKVKENERLCYTIKKEI